MTRKQIAREIDFVDSVMQSHFNDYGEETHRALKEAIDLIEQEPCDDAISREATLEKMADYVASGYADSVKDFEEYSRIICELPPVNPQEPKEGHWIEVIDMIDTFRGEKTWHYECSVCGKTNFGWDKYKYCPNCGAKMVDPQESEG